MGNNLTTRWSESLISLPTKDRADRTCCLICIHPAERLGKIIELGDSELSIGRDSDCDLELADDSVSRRHAVLRSTPDGYTVIDRGSTNGTFVNDVRVESHELSPGDRLRFGNQIFKFLSSDRFEAEYFESAYRMMTTDGLTQAYNKRYLFEIAEREMRRSRRTGRPLSVLMIDIDRFKLINDTLGHLAGDEVLIELCRRLRATLRGDEVLARYGGEEFCLLLPETSLDEAVSAAERLRSVVAAHSFATEHVDVPTTVSIGVSSTSHGDSTSAMALIDRADQQLYAAKRAGRNRVMG